MLEEQCTFLSHSSHCNCSTRIPASSRSLVASVWTNWSSAEIMMILKSYTNCYWRPKAFFRHIKLVPSVSNSCQTVVIVIWDSDTSQSCYLCQLIGPQATRAPIASCNIMHPTYETLVSPVGRTMRANTSTDKLSSKATDYYYIDKLFITLFQHPNP